MTLVALAGARARGDPAFYRKKATWQETIRASRAALIRAEAKAMQEAEERARADPALRAFQPLHMLVDREAPPKPLKVKVAGLKRLCLRVRAVVEDGRRRSALCLGNPRLVAADGKAELLKLSRPWLLKTFGGRWVRDERDREWQAGNPDKDRFRHGLLIGTGSEAVFDLASRYQWLEAWVWLRPTRGDRRGRAELGVDWRSAFEPAENAETDRETIWQLVCRDFALPHQLQEQQWEQDSHIWDDDWPPGDVAALAGRYARACGPDDRQQALALSSRARTPRDLEAVRGVYSRRRTRERLAFARRTLEFVERAGPRPQLAAELAALEQVFEEAGGPANWRQWSLEAIRLRRRIILSHPLLDFGKLLVNLRPPPAFNHMCDQYLGRHSRPGPGLAILENWKESPKATLLLEGKLPRGQVAHPDLSFDAKRVIFSFCDHTVRSGHERRFWIYEISIDGTGLRQLTGTATDRLDGWEGRKTVLIEDFDPCYLPDGGFAFISTRNQTFGRCHGSRYTPAYMLYRADADGCGIRQLSFGEANEWDPAVLDDGRIIYARWDYINRHDTIFQSLWTIRPDGTNTAHFFSNYSRAPCMAAEPQPVPGSHQIVCTATDHHGYTAGTIILVDPRKGEDGKEPMTRLTPEVRFPEAPDWVRGGSSGAYAAPWPLSEDLFLVAYTPDRHGRRHGHSHYAIYLIDTLGGRELVYRHPQGSCFAPIPIQSRPTPPVLPSAIAGNGRQKTGRFYVQRVWQSTQAIEPATIQALRVNRIYGQPTNRVPQRSVAANEVVKSVVGTAAVNADGSAAFVAPAGVPLQLQALDADGMAVMTMRSCVYLQPGETLSCVGCHEPRRATPPVVPATEVTFRPLTLPAGPRYEGGFSFVRTVQPVLDRYCIGCHGLGKTEGGVNLLGTPTRFNQAYDTLTSRGGLVKVAHRNRETAYSKPRDYFAHAGRLVAVLREKHRDRVTLDKASLQRIVDWLDLNAQFYGDYSHNRVESRRPSPTGEKALRQHIAKAFGEKLAGQPFAALVNIAMPSESRVLNAPLAGEAGGWGQIRQGGWASNDAPGYQRMLELVEASITPLSRHDIAGTCGGGRHCSCGGCWVRLLRDQLSHRTARK